MDPQAVGLPIWATILIAFISAMPPTLLALAAFLTSLRNGFKAEQAADRAVIAKEAALLTTEKVNSVIEKLDMNTGMTAKIEEQTNGLVTVLRAEIADLKRQLKETRP